MWYFVVFQPSKCKKTHFQPQIWSIWPIFPKDSESLPKFCYIKRKNSEILSKLRNSEPVGASGHWISSSTHGCKGKQVVASWIYLDSFSSQATSKKAKEEKAHGFGRKLDAEKIIGATNEPGPNQEWEYHIGKFSNADISDFSVSRRVYRVEPPISSISDTLGESWAEEGTLARWWQPPPW